LKKYKLSKVSGIAKDQLFKIFNTVYFNKEYYETHGISKMHLEVEENRAPYRKVFDEVIEFCYYNDVFKQLGIGAMDIYNEFDYGTFTRLRDFMVKENQKKVKHMSDMQAQMDAKQDKILKGNKKNE
jgi:hypothetical protein